MTTDETSRPILIFEKLDENHHSRRLINNGCHEYLNKINELSDKIINSNQSYLLQAQGVVLKQHY
jgi:hypothetical protein